MLREVEGSLLVVKKLNENREVRTSEIATSLLKQLSHFKACKNGYLIEVTKLISIGNGECKFSPQYIIFPVNFLCNFFMPVEGEVMDGVVYRVIGGGVFIKSGPMSYVYLSDRKMPNYNYVLGENRNPRYVGVDLSRIEIGVLIRFRVLAAKWVEDKYREFRVLASIDGDGLGPVSMNGFDGVDFEMPCSNII
ncbi:hypothetical protein ABFX02_07G040500 [Erythranthe guttata]